MSFLAGRLAATEGAYFLHESKHAVGRLAQKLPPPAPPSAAVRIEATDDAVAATADVLPEILRHSVPIKGAAMADASTLSTSSKWLVSGSPSSSTISLDSLNPLRAYVSLPQATFGPRRWKLPDESPDITASTANDLRRDKYPSVDPEKLKAVLAGYSQIGKAFAAATSIIFGGATVLFVYAANKLQLNSTDDVRTQMRDMIQPGVDTVKEQMGPFRTWVENNSRKWRFEVKGEPKERTIIKELSQTLGTRTPN